MRSICFRVLLNSAAIVASTSALFAQVTIDLPDISVQAGGSTSFEVFAQSSGSDRTDITGISFQIQTEDGGPSVGGSVLAPSISSVDVVTGTVFQNNNSAGNTGGSIVPQVFIQETLLNSLSTTTISTGSAPGSKIATVTIDATGFSSGAYSMILDSSLVSTKFTTTGDDLVVGPNLVLLGGTITVVPEPKTALAVSGQLLAFAGLWRCRRTRTARLTACTKA
jgi:hypothetical protein